MSRRAYVDGSSFIEENNSYKNQQKQIQKNQRMPPGMASQELMAYWGQIVHPITNGMVLTKH
jgi:hypothetical protein